jgi:hypothetical protein
MAKLKAIELFEKYFNIIDNSHPLTYINISAKQCALIAADEIIQNNKSFLRTNNELHNDNGLDSDLEYWQEVKQEILKL